MITSDDFHTTPLTAEQRRAMLIRRAWTRTERRAVLRGFWGRVAIAVEPVICGSVFVLLTLGLMVRHQWLLAPIFGLGIVGFAVYAVWLLLAPSRALLATMQPIYIVDGYLRYRHRDNDSDETSRGYVAVLRDDRRVVAEWPIYGDGIVFESIRPAHVEFSDFGGIHRIDGRSTGVLPDTMPPLGIGLPG